LWIINNFFSVNKLEDELKDKTNILDRLKSESDSLNKVGKD